MVNPTRRPLLSTIRFTPTDPPGVLLELMAGAKLAHIPYKGSGPALTGVLAGEVQFIITGIATVLPQAESGRAGIVAVCGE